MPNQLEIPFKTTYIVPIKQAARDYLRLNMDYHPEEFKWDLSRWEELRRIGAGGHVHIESLDESLRYHAQLVSILIKLPTDINLKIPYAPAFAPDAEPVTYSNLAYERAAVIFNIAALYSQLAANGDRSSQEGVKRASVYLQNAAGTLAFLLSSAIPKLVFPSDEEVPVDLSESFIKSLEFLMLAQAQECVWQKAVLDNYKHAIIAKLASRVATLYRSSRETILGANPPIKRSFPPHWLLHLETKQLHFEAAAQYRKSIDDLEAHRYGHEIARLGIAKLQAQTGYAVARRGAVSSNVQQDIKSLFEKVQENFIRAQRDNDLIYHQEVPAHTALPLIHEINMVQSAVPMGLQHPDSALGDEPMIFGRLIGWGARAAIDLYNQRKEALIEDQIVGFSRELGSNANDTLHTLNLPASLEALEKTVRLPPSLLRKAEEVRLEDGPRRIERAIRDVQTLAKRNMDLLDQAMDILDAEVSEDEDARRSGLLDRLPSHKSNSEFVGKSQQYRRILEEAAESDALVRSKWEKWEVNIAELTMDESELEASVPSSTLSLSDDPDSGGSQTRVHARELRKLLACLCDLSRKRNELVDRARRLAENDDVRTRVMKMASRLERWVEVDPVMFEDVFDEELAKYDKFLSRIHESEEKQKELLISIEARNEQYLDSRKEDPSVKNREHALQALDLAFHKYREIVGNLEEGMKFYNDLSTILTDFKESCLTWSIKRKQEIHTLARGVTAPSRKKTADSLATPRRKSSASSSREQRKPSVSLPPLDSGEWQIVEMHPPQRQPSDRARHRVGPC